jgi:hypothetical protein
VFQVVSRDIPDADFTSPRRKPGRVRWDVDCTPPFCPPPRTPVPASLRSTRSESRPVEHRTLSTCGPSTRKRRLGSSPFAFPVDRHLQLAIVEPHPHTQVLVSDIFTNGSAVAYKTLSGYGLWPCHPLALISELGDTTAQLPYIVDWSNLPSRLRS